MNNRTDQLFKDKLGDHRLPPSAEAWSKVEAGLSKKNNIVILWRAAAVFVLFGLLTGAWFYWQSGQQGQPQQLVTKSSGTDNRLDEPLMSQHEKEENKTQVAGVEKTKNSKKVKNKFTEATQEKITEPLPTENLLTEETELVADIKKLPVEPQEKLEKPIVIEFTLDPVPARTLVAQDEVENEKNKGFEKILDKARDIKNGDSELGSLRDVKNELFALDFRKDKTKRN